MFSILLLALNLPTAHGELLQGVALQHGAEERDVVAVVWLSTDDALQQAGFSSIPASPSILADPLRSNQMGGALRSAGDDWRPDSRPGSLSKAFDEQWQGLIHDHLEFYSPAGLSWVGGGVVVAAVMANTAFDEHLVRHSYIEGVVRAPNDEFYEKTHQAKFFGNGFYSIPVFALVALAEPWIGEWPVGSAAAEWSQRSLRTILVGGPPMLALQWLTGASRPGESPSESHWEPFKDSNGVSGHSFMGAIPFLSAAKMSENPWFKGAFYVASVIPALSRVNDDDHYFSQAFLGWWMAFVAASAVDHSFLLLPADHWRLTPAADGPGTGVTPVSQTT